MNQIDLQKAKVSELLGGVSPDLEERVLIEKIIFAPLGQERKFVVEPNGVLNYQKNACLIGDCCQRKMNDSHQLKYFEVVVGKLQKYLSVVEHNIQICSSYRFPTFETSQAEELVEEAFSESFAAVRLSYSK